MKTAAVTLVLLILTTIYAALRYHYFGSAPADWFALWTMNKSISWTASVLLAWACMTSDKASAWSFGLTGFFLMLPHCAVSLWLLDATHYAKLHSGGALTPAALTSMIAGGAGAIAFILPAWSSRSAVRARLGEQRWKQWQTAAYWALALTAIHCLAIGAPGWIAPSTWPGGMPPITLIGFVCASVPVVWRISRDQRRSTANRQ